VGRLARRLDRNVLLCNLMELFDSDDPPHQLENLLRLCDVQRHSVIYLDKLDKALEQWEKSHTGDHAMDGTLEAWLGRAREKLLEDECTVVFTGRDRHGVPESLVSKFDKALIA
jgi:hypothetical protein